MLQRIAQGTVLGRGKGRIMQNWMERPRNEPASSSRANGANHAYSRPHTWPDTCPLAAPKVPPSSHSHKK